MKFIIAIYLFLLTTHSYSQSLQCNCAQAYDSLIKSIETNYISFEEKTREAKNAYDSLKLLTKATVINEKNFYTCYKQLKAYVKWFNDAHLSISLKKDSILTEVYKNTFINMHRDPAVINQSIEDNITGVYKSFSTGYTVEIVRSNNNKYYGKIIKGDSIFWFPGQTKFILQPDIQKHYGKTVFHLKDHSVTETNYFYSENTLVIIGAEIYKKVLSFSKDLSVDFSFYSNASFINLSDSTSYLSLPSFRWEQKAIIDSLLTKHEKELSSKPYLIIDLRNNGGGYSDCFSKLLPFIYSKPVIMPPTYFLASAENIQLRAKVYEKYFTSDTNYNNSLKEHIALMQKSVGTRIKVGDSDTTIMAVLPNPKKIIILTDKGSISAAEDLVFFAQKSDKTVIMGDNTGGIYNSLDVMGTRYLPSPFFQYRCPTVELVGLPNMNKIGFTPHIKLQLKEYNHWISIAQKFLENRETL